MDILHKKRKQSSQTSRSLELEEGRNCWRRSHISDGGFILSGQDFFRAFREALLQAERYVYILAWDISESIELVREEGFDDGHPLKMSDFIFSVLEANPDLEIYILLWDYSLLYLTEREWLPFTQWREKDHPRLHLKTDDIIDVGASHHQKVVVVDETLAFCGGFDLSTWRWDTTKHHADDPRRTTADGESYQPYHDVQLVFTGKAAKDMADLCAQRWLRGTGKNLPRLNSERDTSAWPSSVKSDFQNIETGIALTYSSYKNYQATYQIRRLYLDIIASSNHYIYIENQYLSSHEITEALIQRLKDKDGPEIVIVLTREAGLAEESTLGILRDRLLEKLVNADQYSRFSVLYPFVEDDSGHQTQVYVHAKVLIADDRIIVAGSANLTNRSMKVDSEVDLVINYQKPAEEVKQLLYRLLAIHFDCSEKIVIRSLASQNSLGSMIEDVGSGRPHGLRKLKTGTGSPLLRKIADTQLLDPDEPLSLASWTRRVCHEDQGGQDGKPDWFPYIKWSIVLLAGVLSAVLLNELWGGVLDKESIIRYLEDFRNSRMVIPVISSIFLVGGFVAVPINLLLVASTIAIGPWLSFGCGLTGSLLSAVIAFWGGKRFGRPILKRITGRKLEKISQKLARGGIFSVAIIRVVPVAPFVVVNLVAGLSKLNFYRFLLGSVLGMAPGMLAVIWLSYQAHSAFTEPHWQAWTLLVISLLALGLLFYLLKKIFK